MNSNITGKLPVSEGKLVEDDFLRIMQIVNCRQVVLSMELKKELDTARSTLIGKKGLDSLEYIRKLI